MTILPNVRLHLCQITRAVGALGLVLAALIVVLLTSSAAAAGETVWTAAEMPKANLAQGSGGTLKPRFTTLSREKTRVFTLDETVLRSQLSRALKESPNAPQTEWQIIELPTPDGTLERFYVEEVSIMEAPLAAKFPELKTYRGQGIDDPGATATIDLTPLGFHAQVRSLSKPMWLVDPFYEKATDLYLSHFQKDHAQNAATRFICESTDELQDLLRNAPNPSTGWSVNALSGSTLRTYRLAVGATGEYTAAVGGGTVSGAMSAIVTAINRVDGVYEQEAAIRLVLVGNNDQIVFTDPATDGYTDNSASQIIIQNQSKVDSVIGSANYDIGHVFSTGGGGQSGQIGNVCQAGIKAMCVTGSANPVGDAFYIDYVAHEMGHQFGANHTFNSTGGSCTSGQNGSRTGFAAYEPGSGTTIMAYAGICPPNNTQLHSDPYFHTFSLTQIHNYITTGAGNCGATSAAGNTAPIANAGGSYTIPAQTPFVLTGVGSDANGDPLTYSWEELDLGPIRQLNDPDNGSSPLFRSIPPTSYSDRTFPQLGSVLNGTPSVGETLPVLSRVMNFRLTVRDNRAGGGGVDTADTSLTVVGNAGPFRVTAPVTAVSWQGLSSQTITWDVAGTNSNGINVASVDILLSRDSGVSFPVTLASNVPNNGSATVTLPANPTAYARIKIVPVDNVFLAISPVDFNITGAAPVVTIAHPAHNSSLTALDSISGTAVDPSGSGIQSNQVNLNLFHVSSGQYWNGTAWVSSQATITAPVAGDGSWSRSAGLPTGANARAGQFALSASATSNNGVHSDPQTGVNNTLFTIDNSPPTVAITAPANGSAITTQSYSFGGTAADNNAIDRVVLFLRRNSDNKYWNGSTWITNALSANLPSTYNAGNGTWGSSGFLPAVGSNATSQLINGSYNFIAIAFDAAGNTMQFDSAVMVDFHLIYTWTAGSNSDSDPNNNDHFWGNPANWDPNGIPDTADVVILNINDTIRSTISRTVYDFRMSAGGLNFDNAGDSLNITGHGTWTGGTLNDVINIAAGATFDISGPATKLLNLSGVINNSGIATFAGPGVVQGYQDVNWNNKDGSKFIVTTDGDVFVNFGGNNSFNNQIGAQLIKTLGDGASSTNFRDWTFNNAGVIDSRQGTMKFNSTLNLTPASYLAGAGRILLQGVTNVTALVNGNGNPELAGILNGNSVGAAFNVSNPFIWTSGTIHGTFSLAAGTVLNLSSASTKLLDLSAVFTNYGRVNWLSGGPLQGYQDVVFNNEAGATFDATTDGDIFANFGGNNSFNNKPGALFVKSGKSATPTESLVDDWIFNNSGAVRADDGQLHFNSALNLNSGGTIARNGGLPAAVRSTATMTSTGTTTVSNITLETSGIWSGNTAMGTAGNGTIATSAGGVFAWTGGTTQNVVNIAPASTFAISGDSQKQISQGGVINNAGNAIFSGNGALQGFQDVTFNNTGSFTAVSDADFTNNGGNNHFINAVGATFQKTGGSEITRFDWFFDNHGTVTSTAAALAMNGGGSSHGTFTATNPAAVQFTGGNHDLTGAADFTGTGKVQILGGTVNATNTMNADSTNGLLEIGGGTVTSVAAGSFNILGHVSWTGGTIGGTFNIKSGSTFLLTGDSPKDVALNGVINNQGAASWTGPGTLRGLQNSIWNNKSGSSFSVTTDGDVFANNGGGNIFNNEAGATFVKTAGAGGCANSLVDDWTFNNAGTLTSQQGTLRFNTTLNLNNGSSLTGADLVLLAGTINLNAVLNSSGRPELTGALTGTNASAGFSGVNPFTWSSGSISGTFTLAAASVLDLTTAGVKQIGLGSTFTNNGRVNWKAGSLQGYQDIIFNNESGAIFDATTDGDIFSAVGGNNVFNNKAGATFLKSGRSATPTDTSLVDNWSFNNSGIIRSDDGVINFNTALNLNAGGAITHAGNLAARVISSSPLVLTGTTSVSNITFESASDWNGNTAQGTAGNGTIATGGGGVFEWTGGAANNVVNIAPGSTFLISGSRTKQIGLDSVLNNFGNATWTGTGAIQGYQSVIFNNAGGATFLAATTADFVNFGGGNKFINNGQLFIGSPLGVTDMNWDYVQGSSGRLNLEMNGTNAATPQFDQLHVNGSATLAGTVAIMLRDGFVPVPGSNFAMITYQSHTGSFESTHTLGTVFDFQYNANSLNLVAKQFPTDNKEWKSYYFDDPSAPEAQPLADPNNNGLPNLLEYALGRNPLVAGGAPITSAALAADGSMTDSVTIGGVRYMSMSYTRPAGPAALTDVTYAPERAIALLNPSWAEDVVVYSTTPGPTQYSETVTVRSTHPMSESNKEFLRLKVSLIP